jgi:hypothetical protein
MTNKDDQKRKAMFANMGKAYVPKKKPLLVGKGNAWVRDGKKFTFIGNLHTTASSLRALEREPLEGARHHKLLPAEILKKLPPLYAQEKVKDPMVYVKFFTPMSDFTWYVTEYDPKQKLMFGYVARNDYTMSELGYTSFDEISKLSRGGMPMVERDTSFSPQPLSKCKGVNVRVLGLRSDIPNSIPYKRDFDGKLFKIANAGKLYNEAEKDETVRMNKAEGEDVRVIEIGGKYVVYVHKRRGKELDEYENSVYDKNGQRIKD